jgi:ferredoxin
MRIELDRDTCMGSATCVGFVPKLIKIGKDGHAMLLSENVDGVDDAALAEAVANCPVEAIRLVDADQ